MTRARGLWAWAAALAVSCGSAHAMTYPYVVESRADGKNNGFYSETGAWVDSPLHSIADGLTPGIGSRCATTAGSKANFKLNADFTGDGLGASTMNFEVFVTWPAPLTAVISSPTKFTVTSDDPIETIFLNQNMVGRDVWYSLGTYTFTENTDYFVTIESLNDNVYVDAWADAVKWVPVPEPASTAFVAIGGMALLRRRRRA